MESLPLEPFISAQSVMKRYSYFTVVDAVSSFNDDSLWFEVARIPEPIEKEVLTEIVIAACTFPEKSLDGLYIFTVHANMLVDTNFFKAIFDFLESFLLKTELKSSLIEDFLRRIKPLTLYRSKTYSQSVSSSSVQSALSHSFSDVTLKKRRHYSLIMLRAIGKKVSGKRPTYSSVVSMGNVKRQSHLPPTVPKRSTANESSRFFQVPEVSTEVASHMTYLRKLGIDLITPKAVHDKLLAFIYSALTSDISMKTVIIDLNEESQRQKRKKELRASITRGEQRQNVYSTVLNGAGVAVRVPEYHSDSRSFISSAAGSENIHQSTLPPIPDERTLHSLTHREILDLVTHFQEAFPNENYFENVTKTRTRGVLALLKHADIIDSISPIGIAVQICLRECVTSFQTFKRAHDDFLIQATTFSGITLSDEDLKVFIWTENEASKSLNICDEFVIKISAVLATYPRGFLDELTAKSALAIAETAAANDYVRASAPLTISTLCLSDRIQRNFRTTRSSSTSSESFHSKNVDSAKKGTSCITRKVHNVLIPEVSPSLSTLSVSPDVTAERFHHFLGFTEGIQCQQEETVSQQSTLDVESFYNPFARSSMWTFPIIAQNSTFNSENGIPLSDYLRDREAEPGRVVFQTKSENVVDHSIVVMATKGLVVNQESSDNLEPKSPFEIFDL